MPRRSQEAGDLCAIFIHAGAGYHSHQNEKSHLTAVHDAARVGMAVLKNGGDATDAVEMAIRLLEDKEITNAGFGSNLTMDGRVECDATVVDHLGRSGAVGAISQVKNPVVVARLVLDESTKPLSLQRVPPNLLVGTGATEYAADKGVPVLPPDFLVSQGARIRWVKWQQDLEKVRLQELEAHVKASKQDSSEANNASDQPQGAPATPVSAAPHTPTSPPPVPRRPSLSNMPTMTRPLVASTADVPTLFNIDAGPQPAVSGSGSISSRSGRQHNLPDGNFSREYSDTRGSDSMQSTNTISDHYDVGTDDSLLLRVSASKRQKLSDSFDGPPLENSEPEAEIDERPCTPIASLEDGERDDEICDTVGAIAIDCFGRIAAGSSSGGIGMKHRGRCGPAALVGIGTAVIPVDPTDPSGTCVATVTSGTGEHMATTTAAATAADRIYNSVCKENGRLRMCNEDDAMRAVIMNDFMAHPGVSNSHCTGAIGILAVKKTRDGIYFYFGHNTDSFALASMHSEEKKPVCTMSRSRGHGSVAQGGRVCRSKYARTR